MNVRIEEQLDDKLVALELLEELAILKENKKALVARESKLVNILKQFMQFEDMVELRDGERGITARLRPNQGTPELDVLSMADRDQEMLLKLADLGCLKVDFTTFRSNFGKSSAVDGARAKYLMPGKEREDLIVDRD
jgi:hypothetical protein